MLRRAQLGWMERLECNIKCLCFLNYQWLGRSGSELWASIFPTTNWGAKELRISSFPKTDTGASQIRVKPTQQIPPPGAHPWPRRMPTGGLERCFSCRRRGYLVLPTRPDPILPKPSWWTHGYRSLSPVFDKMIFAVDTAICHPNKLPNIRVGLECFFFFFVCGHFIWFCSFVIGLHADWFASRCFFAGGSWYSQNR